MASADAEYRDKLAVAIYDAIVNASRDESGVATVHIANAFDALMLVGSMIISRSEFVDSPPKLKRFCHTLSARFLKQVRAAQAGESVGKLFQRPKSPWDPRG